MGQVGSPQLWAQTSQTSPSVTVGFPTYFVSWKQGPVRTGGHAPPSPMFPSNRSRWAAWAELGRVGGSPSAHVPATPAPPRPLDPHATALCLSLLRCKVG